METFTDFWVLVVEDDFALRAVAVTALEILGVNVRSAENGIEALGLAECVRFDLILMDCQMPELDGYETTLRLRGDYPLARHTRIVALSANRKTEEKARGLKS